MKPHFTCSDNQKKDSRKGFTLTEFAIVLGIFAMMLAGIWSAASYMWQAVRHAEFSEVMTVIIEDIRSLYSNNINFDAVDKMMPKLKEARVFPDSFVVPNERAVRTPVPESWLDVCGWDSSGNQEKCDSPAGVNPTMFALEYTFGRRQDCITAVTKNSSPATFDGLVAVYLNREPRINAALPWTVEDANLYCKGTTSRNPARVQFIFRLNP